MAEHSKEDRIVAAVGKEKNFILSNPELTFKILKSRMMQQGWDGETLDKHKALIKEQVQLIVDQEEDEEEEEENKAKARKRKPAKAEKGLDKARKKQKKEKQPDPKVKASGRSKEINDIRKVLVAADIKISPSLYKNKDEDLKHALLELLKKHGLSVHSSSSDIATVKKRLAKERDLEGIDLSNVVEGRPRRAAANVSYKDILKQKLDDEEEEDEEEEEEEEEEDSDNDSEDEEDKEVEDEEEDDD
jgi:hypothetical protein